MHQAYFIPTKCYDCNILLFQMYQLLMIVDKELEK